MKITKGVERWIVPWGAALAILVPALQSEQTPQVKPAEKPQVVDMGSFRINAPPGKGWKTETNIQLHEVQFSQLKQGFLDQAFNQQRGTFVFVKADFVNIYGWTSSEDETADQIFASYESASFPPRTKFDREAVEWGGKKLHTTRPKGEGQGGSAAFLYFPPDFAKSHVYFIVVSEFVEGGNWLKLYGNPGLAPVQSIIASLEVVDPLQAVAGPLGDLFRAAAAGDEAGATRAIEGGADVNAACRETGVRALTTAAYYGRKGVIDLLLSKGAAFDDADETSGRTPLLAALIGGETEIAGLFVKKGADVNRSIDAGGGGDVTPLMFATALKNLGLVRAIADAGAKLDSRTVLGESAFVLAADNGWADGLAFFIEKGADVNTRMKNGWTALMRAASRGHSGIVSLLLDNKADVDLKSNDTDRNSAGWTALLCAAGGGHVEVVKTLIEHGADVRVRSLGTGDTALHLAAYSGSKESALLLIKAGADVNAKNANNATPLKIAKTRKDTDLVRVLQAAGAK